MARVIIAGGMVIDGTGRPGYPADVVIEDDRIEEIVPRPQTAAKEAEGREDGRYEPVDARGLIVAPGFIDAHSHSDLAVLLNPQGESKIRQGVTTEVIGQCGSSGAPLVGAAARERSEFLGRTAGLEIKWQSLAEYLAEVERRGVSVNVAPMVGHGNLRAAAMGWENRAPSLAEMEEMKRLLRQAMEEGSFGLSTGLIYPPGTYSQTEEIIELARVAAAYGGIYGSHIRGESDTVIEAVAEALRVGKEAGISVEISHHKAAGRKNWGKVKTTLALLEAARERGVAAGCDVYPYTAASTSLGSLVPSWAHAGGKEAFLGRLRDPAVRERLKREIEEGIPGWENFIAAAGYDNILITRANRPDSDLPGQTIAEIARARRTEPAETIFDLLLEEENNIGMVLFLMQEEDVREVIRFPGAVIGSDASAAAPYGPLGKGKPHPRSYGTFARILGKYVRQEGLLSLEEAISKMTSQTAKKYGLKGRGILQRGYQADLVVFDRQKISDRASYQEPHQYAQGVEYVLVNGVMTVAKGEHTGALAGHVLRRGQ